MEKIITFVDALKAGLVSSEDLEGVREIAVSIGAVDAASRHLDGIGPRLVVYLRTATGTRGTGAHPGFVTEIAEDVAHEVLGYSYAETVLSAGANLCTVRGENGTPCCEDCAAAAGGRTQRLSSRHPDRQKVCTSCATMIREGWEEHARDRDAREAS